MHEYIDANWYTYYNSNGHATYTELAEGKQIMDISKLAKTAVEKTRSLLQFVEINSTWDLIFYLVLFTIIIFLVSYFVYLIILKPTSTYVKRAYSAFTGFLIKNAMLSTIVGLTIAVMGIHEQKTLWGIGGTLWALFTLAIAITHEKENIASLKDELQKTLRQAVDAGVKGVIQEIRSIEVLENELYMDFDIDKSIIGTISSTAREIIHKHGGLNKPIARNVIKKIEIVDNPKSLGKHIEKLAPVKIERWKLPNGSSHVDIRWFGFVVTSEAWNFKFYLNPILRGNENPQTTIENKLAHIFNAIVYMSWKNTMQASRNIARLERIGYKVRQVLPTTVFDRRYISDNVTSWWDFLHENLLGELYLLPIDGESVKHHESQLFIKVASLHFGRENTVQHPNLEPCEVFYIPMLYKSQNDFGNLNETLANLLIGHQESDIFIHQIYHPKIICPSSTVNALQEGSWLGTVEYMSYVELFPSKLLEITKVRRKKSCKALLDQKFYELSIDQISFFQQIQFSVKGAKIEANPSSPPAVAPKITENQYMFANRWIYDQNTYAWTAEGAANNTLIIPGTSLFLFWSDDIIGSIKKDNDCS